ncbi:hypothetical protein CYY_004588 [Polysphondylium violaceum]|uniref:PH domain-containing protein n=1 Tax=Polysphondylium violaceum TaxID=133409 RepID=A0A8J4PT48_9MYCE|nr:hypothetical protein CYY_004588 [Polysphondylium violaceum]
MEYKSGALYKLGGGIFKIRKKYWFVLTTTHFQYYNSPEKTSNPIESISLNEIKNITLLQKEIGNLGTTYGFIVEYLNNSKLILQSDSLSSIADWVIKLDGLIHSDFKSFLNQVERRLLLKILYKNNIKGGIIKTSDSDQEWNYSSLGTLFIDAATNTGDNQEEKIDYHWDGEWLRSSSHNQTLGCGRFNGVYLAWYTRDLSIPDIRYFYDEKEKEYISDKKEFTFKWTRHFLASKYGSGEWIVEGHVPAPVVMFLQLIKYKRNSNIPGYPTPFPPTENPNNNINNQNIENNSSTPSLSSTPSSPSTLLSTTQTPRSTTISCEMMKPLNLSEDDPRHTSGSPISSSSPALIKLLKNSDDTSPTLASIQLPEGSNKASTMKISPFTKGNALLNVSNVLFTTPTYDEPEKSNDDSLISSFLTTSTSSDDLDLENKTIIDIQFNNNEDDNNIQNQNQSNNDQNQQNNNNNNNNNNSKIHSLEKLANIPKLNTSCLQLLDDTINQSNEIQTNRKSFSDPSLKLIEKVIDNEIKNEIKQEQEQEKEQEQEQQQQQEKHKDIEIIKEKVEKLKEQSEEQEESILNFSIDSTSSNQSSPPNINSPSFKNTTPLGSIIGPSAISTTPSMIATIEQQEPKSLLSSHRKPLAKSRSSDKVTTIINQISQSKQVRTSFCIACNLPISGHMAVAQGNHYHQECFKCYKCQKELGTKTFYRPIEQSSSSNNFVTLSSSPTSPSKYSSSPTLLSVSLSQSPVLSPSSLSSSISSISSSNTTNSNHSSNNNNSNSNNHHHHHHHHNKSPKYICQSCFNDTCPICPKCNSNVMYRCVNAMGKKWHPDHFCCVECQCLLLNTIYFEKNGLPYCQNDYNRLFNNVDKVVQQQQQLKDDRLYV